jgi:hypothetical protein
MKTYILTIIVALISSIAAHSAVVPPPPTLPIPLPPITSYKEGAFTNSQKQSFTTRNWFSDRGIEVTVFLTRDGRLFATDQFFYSAGSKNEPDKCEIIRYMPDYSIYGRWVPSVSGAHLYNSKGKEMTIDSWELLK